MSKRNYGQVTLEIQGEEYTLVPSLKASDKIDGRFGSAREAADAALKMSTHTLAHIVAAGAGIGQREFDGLREAIFKHGTANVAPKCVEFCLMLLNPTGSDVEEKDSGEE